MVIKKFLSIFEPEEICQVEEKKKAISKFCQLQKNNCGKCWVYYKLPWADECRGTDEEVDRAYKVIYGDENPINILHRWEVLEALINGGILDYGILEKFILIHKFIK